MSDPGFWYFFSHPGSVGASLGTPIALLLLVFAFFFPWRFAHPVARRAGLLRSAAWVLLTFALAGLALTVSLPAERMTLVAAVDVSDSIDEEGRTWSRDFVNRIASTLAPGDELAVVTFAGDTRVARSPGDPRALDELPFPPSTAATDLGRSLETALALLPPDTAHRILLITDGNETRGSVRHQLARARRANAAVYTVVPPHAGGGDASVEKIVVPPLVTEGSVFPIRLIANNSHGTRPATLTLLLDDTPVGTEKITLEPGRNSFEIPFRLEGIGSHRLRAQISVAGDSVSGNDYRETPVAVAGPPRVLVLSENRYSPIAGALDRKGMAIERRSPSELAQEPDALLPYHCIVLENAVAKRMPAGALEALERYVRDFGGGLVFAGGRSTFGDAAFRQTPLKRLLPVTLEPRREPPRERDPLALMVLIDRSNSMGYSSHSRPGSSIPRRDRKTSKLHYAKTAALAVIEQLRDSDFVGVAAFDSRPFPIAVLGSLKVNRGRLRDLIPRLVENGGTDFYDALELAREQLAASEVLRRHLILLTDGDTNRTPEDHYPLIAALAEAGVSVTTIRIGGDVVNVELLSDIASKTGGRFYHIENEALLPQLMLRDTTAALNSKGPGPEKIRPRIGAATQLLRGLDRELPALRQYAFSKPKRGADVPLHVPGRRGPEPVLAAWQYGLGRVVAFTADPAADAGEWLEWKAYGKFWSQVVRWAMREQTPGDYVVRAMRRDGQATLQIRAFDAKYDSVLLARIHLGDNRFEDLTMVPVAPRLFEAPLPREMSGKYPITVLRGGGGGAVGERTDVVDVPAHDEEPQEEFQAIEANRALLRQLAAETGGKVNPTARELATRGPGNRIVRYGLGFVLVPLAMLLFLADVAVRRLRLLPEEGAPGA